MFFKVKASIFGGKKGSRKFNFFIIASSNIDLYASNLKKHIKDIFFCCIHHLVRLEDIHFHILAI